MRNAGLEETQAGIKIAGRNINNLRYADDTRLMAESEEDLKSLLMKVKEESEKVKLVSIESVMPSNHLILCRPLLLLPSVFPRVFSNESALRVRRPRTNSFEKILMLGKIEDRRR